MRKSTMFISAMLTMFLLATMFGVASAYRQIVQNNETQAAKAEAPVQAVAQPVAATAVPALQSIVVSPEQATTMAINFLGDTNVYSVETVTYEGSPAYLVTFSSGDLVYVSSSGVVLANTKLAPIVVAAASNGGNSGNSNNNQSSNTGNNGGSDDHENHESHDDDHDGGDD